MNTYSLLMENKLKYLIEKNDSLKFEKDAILMVTSGSVLLLLVLLIAGIFFFRKKKVK